MNSFSGWRWYRSLTGAVLCLILLAALWQSAPADEFAVVPASDSIYSHLKTLHQAGLVEDIAVTITRYEAAVETAKAAFTVTARLKTGAPGITYSTETRDALRALLVLLRPEMRKLQVDVAGSLAILGDKPSPEHRFMQPERTPPEPDTSPPLFGAHRVESAWPLDSGNPAEMRQPQVRYLDLPLAQRLRVSSTLFAMERDRTDPFGEWSDPTAVPYDLKGGSDGGGSLTRTSWDVSRWLSVYASYEARRRGLTTSHAQARLFGNEDYSGLGTGLGINLTRNVQLSGQVSMLRHGNQDRLATRIAGGLDLTAWQNRLSFNAHFARLLPEDSLALSSTAAEFNLGVDVSQRLSVKLLYQQLFDANAAAAGTDRMLSGGVSISF